MPPPRLIVSTVGASLLYNHLGSDGAVRRQFLNRVANHKQLDPADAAELAEILDRATDTLDSDDTQRIRRGSAELNGIYALYHNQLGQGRLDTHILVATDTELGRRCANLVEAFLQRHGFPVIQHVPRQLTTATTADFEAGSKELICWLAETLPGYRAQEYEVIFNLVAAFKALQGYLNVIGMLYADKILYLFEGSNQEPILIPRLPIELNYTALQPFVVQLAMMAEGTAIIPISLLQGLSRVLFDEHDGSAIISQWGLLAWYQMRDDALKELLNFPRMQYDSSFRRDFDNLGHDKRLLLQCVLARVATLLEESGGSTARLKADHAIQYEDLRNVRISGQPVGHFRFSDGYRVSCIAENQGLTLRRCSSHDTVLRHP